MTSKLLATEGIFAIPFKQRIYQYLVKLYEDSNWEDILASTTDKAKEPLGKSSSA